MRRLLLKGLLSTVAMVLAVALSLTGTYAKDVTKATDKPKTEAKGAAVKVDINSASQAELEKLPGVGAATAKKIIAGRPYASVADLSKAGVSAKTIGKITPLVTVGAAPAAAPVAVPKATAPAAPAKAAREVQPPPATSGMVWVNPDSKIYHKPGSQWYGKTKQGSYMTEAEAIKAGYRESKQGGK